MKSVFEQLKAEGLTASEKQAMRRALMAHMRHEGATPSPYVPMRAPFWIWVRARAMVPTMIVTLLMMATGVSYAASGTLPGDILYPIKVSINEPLRVFFAGTPAARAQVQVTLAGERLAEAEKLALRGDLSGAQSAVLGAQASAHIAKAAAGAMLLGATDREEADGIKQEIGSTLKAHATVLIAIAGRRADQKDAVTVPLAAISAQINAGVENNDLASSSISLVAAAPSPVTSSAATIRVHDTDTVSAKDQAAIATYRAKAFQEIADLESKLDGAGNEVKKRAQRARDAAQDGDQMVSSGNVDGARKAYAKAAEDADEGAHLVDLESELNITIGGDTSTDTATTTATTTSTAVVGDQRSISLPHGEERKDAAVHGLLSTPPLDVGGE